MKNITFKSLLKPYFFIPIILIFLTIFSFIGWYVKPSKSLSVAVIDKTVPATAADSYSYLDDVSNNYRKHIGLYWLMDYMKIKSPETGKPYNYKTDYYGPQLDENSEIYDNNSITQNKETPDVLYLSDSYGVEIYNDHGINTEEMNTIANCYSSGATLIGEQDILTTGTDNAVKAELQSIFGISSTGWVGRYIYDLRDLTDVPYWAPDMWRAKYGQEWNCSGPGILLVSGNGDILVLEEKTDFESKNLFKISVADGYKDEFGKHSLNFYNWFELIETSKSTEVIATYNFNLNSTGAEEFAVVSDTTTFAAVTRSRNKDGTPAYYFAGDFNDYPTKLQIHNFLFADSFFRLLSFDRDGDVTNFYWNFYEPLMKDIIKDATENTKDKESTDTPEENKQLAKVNDNGFSLLINGEWTPFNVKGFNINGESPGDARYTYSREYSYYNKLITALGETGGNCIRTYDVLPPEFYRALYEYNKTAQQDIYLIQGLLTPKDIKGNDYITKADSVKKEIDYMLLAVYGKGKVDATEYRQAQTYSYNVSKFIMGYIIDPAFKTTDTDTILSGENKDYSYSGKFISGNGGVEAITAQYCDYALDYLKTNYGYLTPVSLSVNAERLEGAQWVQGDAVALSYNLSSVNVSEDAKEYYFVSYSLNTDDSILLNNTNAFASYTDESGVFTYGGYIESVKKLIHGPALIDRAGLSANTNTFEKETSINGLSEKSQGEGVVRMLSASKKNGYIGMLIADLNDNWSDSDTAAEKYTHILNDGLWHDVTDRKETTGIIAVEAGQPSKVAMELNDNAASSMLRQMQLSYNESYMYVTLLLAKDIDFDSNQLIIGIDTYQRNNGEYYYDKNFFANSQSGMEYIVRFESKTSASLYVTKSYNINTGNYSTKESYNSEYDLVSVLSYGNFSTSTTHFYQSGVTIRVRIPWAMLNFSDPASQLVIDGFENNTIKTTKTDGIIFSVLIGNKFDKDTDYIFPESKKSAGYKRLILDDWGKPDIRYEIRKKESVVSIKKYFDMFQ